MPKKKSDAMMVAEMMYSTALRLFREHSLIRFDSGFFLWNEEVWRQESEENTMSWIAAEWMRMHSSPCTETRKREIANMLRDLTYGEYRLQIKHRQEGARADCVSVRSGMLDLRTLETRPRTKEDFVFQKLPFDYVPDPVLPEMERFLATSMGFGWPLPPETDMEDYGKVMDFVQEWMGYTLSPLNPFEKGLIMHGEGRNGKGVLQKIWATVLGRQNVSHVDIVGINDGREVFMTRNRLANFSSDITSGQQLDTAVLKKAISGEIVTAHEKYKPEYEMPFTAKIIMLCNEMPFVRDSGAAVRERFHVLPFRKVFSEGERDPYLLSRLEAEAGQIFSWAVNGLVRLRKRGRFDLPRRCMEAAEGHMLENDSVEEWIQEEQCRAEGSKAERKEAWKHYRTWCEKSGLKAGGKTRFYSKMERKGFRRMASNGVWHFEGLALPNALPF
jgi:putative DNA primase/helicase